MISCKECDVFRSVVWNVNQIIGTLVDGVNGKFPDVLCFRNKPTVCVLRAEHQKQYP